MISSKTDSLNYSLLEAQIYKQVGWITSHKGHEEAMKLLPLLEKSWHKLERAIKYIEDKKYKECINLLGEVIEVNRHSYLFTNIFVVQSAIYGRDALRASGHEAECLDWVLKALSATEMQEIELRYMDDLAEMHHLLMEEWDRYPKRLVDETDRIIDRASKRNPRDRLSEGLAILAQSHLAILEGNIDKSRILFNKAESLIDVSNQSLVCALRCCILAEIEANMGRFDTATQAAAEAESIYKDFGRNAYVFYLSKSQGDIFFRQKSWTQAGDAYIRAVKSANELYRIALMVVDKEEQLKKVGLLYRNAGYTLARAGRLNEAVVCFEQGLARGLGDSLARDQADLQRVQVICPDAYLRFKNAADKLQKLEKPGFQGQVSEIRENVRKARREMEESVELIREIEGYKDFLQENDFSDIENTVIPGQPMVYLTTTEAGSIALILHRSTLNDKIKLDSIRVDEFTQDRLTEILVGPSPKRSLGGWFGSYMNIRFDLDGWKRTVEKVSQALWILMGPIVKLLLELNCNNAVLIPEGHLSLLPLHAAWNEEGGNRRYAIDEITFSYAPSASALNHSRNSTSPVNISHLLAVPNPDGSLAFAEREVEDIAPFFQKVSKYTKKYDILSALPDAHVVHFSCHGKADFKYGIKSSLILSKEEQITVQDLLSIGVNPEGLVKKRLAVFSACESGIVGTDLPNEIIGLPAAFLRMGFSGAIGTLWPVQDRSTWLLMTRFYENWRLKKRSPAQALREAQLSLKDDLLMTRFYENWRLKKRSPTQALREAQLSLKDDLSKYPEYGHPYYWAAFYLIGT